MRHCLFWIDQTDQVLFDRFIEYEKGDMYLLQDIARFRALCAHLALLCNLENEPLLCDQAAAAERKWLYRQAFLDCFSTANDVLIFPVDLMNELKTTGILTSTSPQSFFFDLSDQKASQLAKNLADHAAAADESATTKTKKFFYSLNNSTCSGILRINLYSFKSRSASREENWQWRVTIFAGYALPLDFVVSDENLPADIQGSLALLGFHNQAQRDVKRDMDRIVERLLNAA